MHPVGELRGLGGGVSDGDPGLADSRWSEQGQQSGVVAFNELGYRSEFCGPADRMVGKNWERWDRWFSEVGCGEQGGAVGLGQAQPFGQQSHGGQSG